MATRACTRPHAIHPTRSRRLGGAVLALALVLLVAACSSDGSGGGGEAGADRLRLGYFPNLTHATALVGLERGIFAEQLGQGVKLEPKAFNAGPAVVEAVFSGAVDASYIGPNPAINAFTKSRGEAVRIISGATSGGAFLVVKPELASVQSLRGRRIATPQLGNTQDVALRSWLARIGLKTTAEGGGDVEVVPQENSQTLETFRSGEIDGAWVPEPWATRLEQEGGGRVLVDEATLWPGGRYVTTHLMVRTEFLKANPEVVERLLRGQVQANKFVDERPAEAQKLANQGIEKLTGKALAPQVVAAAWKRLEFTDDPVAASLRTSAANAKALGFLSDDDLDGIYDLGPLNKVLASLGEGKVAT